MFDLRFIDSPSPISNSPSSDSPSPIHNLLSIVVSFVSPIHRHLRFIHNFFIIESGIHHCTVADSFLIHQILDSALNLRSRWCNLFWFGFTLVPLFVTTLFLNLRQRKCIGFGARSFMSWPKRLLVFVNPFGGKKSAMKIFDEQVKTLFEDAQIQLTKQETAHQLHAKEVAHSLDITKHDGIVCVSGDGILVECLSNHNIFMRTLIDMAARIKCDMNDNLTLETNAQWLKRKTYMPWNEAIDAALCIVFSTKQGVATNLSSNVIPFFSLGKGQGHWNEEPKNLAEMYPTNCA
ncbi:hypothetical protein TSUD_21870 [Trifolium subterraneum]|uniref:DAGKc domain-containing protein n=1 Tax=Trifolium subterraneum TaxID=3900 RepID=A0A2Z6MYQ0_TRISU|nr:hypothetical protein TSUD_21870 [Trifolium subterraneum]